MKPWARRALAWVLALWCALGVFPAVAQALDVGGPQPSLEPGELLELRADEPPGLLPLQALPRAGWVAATPRRLNPGINPGPLWLRLRLVNHGAETVTRWVVMGSPRLDDVRAYEISADGAAVRQAWVGGSAHPLRLRPVAGIKSIFPVVLRPAQEVVFLARVHNLALLQLDVQVWEPAAYREDEGREALRVLLPLTLMLVMAVYFLALGLAQRERLLWLLAAWLLLALCFQLAHQGYTYRWLLQEGCEAVARLRMVLLNLAAAGALLLLYQTLELRRLAPWRHVYRPVLAGLGGLALAAPWADLRLVAYASTALGAMVCAFAPLSVWHAWRRGLPRVGLVLLPFAVWWLNAVGRGLQTQGLFPQGLGGNTGTLWSSLANVAVAMLAVVSHYRGAVGAKLAAQAEQLRRRDEEQARLERAVAERTQALQAALIAAKDANEAKNDFLARVSHDLRTPLTSIMGYAGLVSGSGGREAEHGRVILHSAQHLLALLNDLIDYARGGVQPAALQVAPTYTAALLEGLAAEGRALAARQDNRFEFRVRGTLPPAVEADAKRLRQVLQNLLGNAAKFTRGGEVVFEVQVSAVPDGGGRRWFHFTVSDTGPGIDPEVLPHLFEPFQRTRAADRPEGLGLGLAIAKTWVERMGGHIDAQSRPGEGATLQVELPLRPVAEDAIAFPQRMLAQERLPEFDGGGRRLWVVEDSAAIREMLCAELEGLNFEVLALPDGAQAVARLADAAQDAPDLVLTDLQMPGVDGQGVCDAVHRRWPALPVVLLSAALESSVRAEHGFAAVLGKPVSRAHLRTTLAGLLGLPLGAGGEEPVPPSSLQPPTADYLAEFARLVRLGAVSDVADWAAELAAGLAAWSGFLERLQALADAGDLKGCERMLAHAHEPAAAPAAKVAAS